MSEPLDGDEGGRTGPRTVPRPVPWATLLVVTIYVIAAVIVYWKVWSTHPSGVTQTGGDQAGTIWFLEWVPFALRHGHNPFFSAFGNYPFGVNLLTNTSVPLLGLAGAPITLLFGPVATYNLLLTLGLAGSATAGYAFARRWVQWRPAAFVGGLLYGFSPYQIAQSSGGHLNLTFVVLPPLILLVVHQLVVRQQGSPRRWGIALGLLLVGQFFISSEVMASTMVIGAICVAVVAIIGHRSVAAHLRHVLVGSAWAGAVAAVLLAYPVWFALRGSGSISGPIQLVPQGYRADLLGPIVPDRFVWLAPSSLTHVADNFSSSTTENGSYLGITLLFTLVLGAVLLWRRSVVARVAAIAGVAAFVLSLGAGLVVRQKPSGVATGVPLPERLFTKLPLLSNTVPARYSLYVMLFAGLLLALILDRVHQVMASRTRAHHATEGRVRSWVLPGVVGLVCLVPLIPNGPVAGIGPVGVPSFFTSATVSQLPADSPALVYPYPSAATPNGLLWQATADMRFAMPGGYFLLPDRPRRTIAFSAAAGYNQNTLTARTLLALYAGTPPPETPALRTALRAQWRSWGIQSLIEVPGGDPRAAQAVAWLTWLTGRSATPEAGVNAWYHLDLS